MDWFAIHKHYLFFPPFLYKGGIIKEEGQKWDRNSSKSKE